MLPYLQRLAETTTDPRTRAICFVLARGGQCDHAELVAFMKQGEIHPERVKGYLANLKGVLELNTLGRLVVMPPAQWPLRQIRRMSVPAQLGLPTKDDLVDEIARSTPPPVVSTPPVVGDTSTFIRSNVPDQKRATFKRPHLEPDALREKVQAFVTARDFARFWRYPRYDEIFEDPERAAILAASLRYLEAGIRDGTVVITKTRGAALWEDYQRNARLRFQT